MCAISLYECLGFYWIGFFKGRGTAVRWLLFIGIILILYFICAVLYQKYSKKQGEIYTRGLQKYQMERSILSVIVPIGVLILGLHYNAAMIAIFMFIIEVVFCGCLIIENRIEN